MTTKVSDSGGGIKDRLAKTIVRYRAAILAAVVLVAVWSAFQIGRTNINYDLTKYLADDTMTKQALNVMNEEFGASEQLRLMFENRAEEDIEQIAATLSDMPEIAAVQHDPAVDLKQEDGSTWQLITVTLGDCDATALVTTLREKFPGVMVGGQAAQQLDVQNSLAAEIPEIMMISVAVIFIVLLLTSHAWLEPVLLLIVFSISILINMGTNFLFPDISFITFAVCAVLQLALSIDYAIMLLHTWNAFCDSGMSAREAMEKALVRCFMRIASSALTTAAGLLSLLFMSFTIGFDIGLVLSKGVLISVLGVFLVMPALTLLLKTPLQKTRHKPLQLGGEKLGKAIYRGRKPVAIVLIAAVLCGAYVSFRNEYSFTALDDSVETDTAKIAERFGASTPLAVLIPGDETDESYDRQRALVQDLKSLKRADGSPAIRNITAMVTTGEAALKEYSPADVAEMTGIDASLISAFFSVNGFGETVRADRLLDAAEAFFGKREQVAELKAQLDAAREAFIGEHYHRMLIEPDFAVTDEDFTSCMDAVLAAVERHYGDTFYITGEPMSTYDIGNAFQSDLLNVNLITLFAILLIVILSFRALILPMLLVLVIEGAIWINMSINSLSREPVFFISYLICLSIQMGATIDYGILVSDQYRILRSEGMHAADALRKTLRTSLPTVLTSGIILITAGYIIGRRCSIYYISSVGLMLARGTLLSVILVLVLLPALLTVFDRWICGRERAKKTAE